MSCDADKPEDFLDWSRHQGVDDPQAFIPRALYGDYLFDRLSEAVDANPRRFTHHPATVTGLSLTRDGVTVTANGDRRDAVAVDRLVLAIGFPRLPVVAPLTDPWAPQSFEELDPASSVIILGTGLTMIDTVIALLDRGHRGLIQAISRRALLPRAHAAPPNPAGPPCLTAAAAAKLPAHALLRAVRATVRSTGDWRTVIDGLRDDTPEIWAGLPRATQRALLRHVQPWWDVHRHRMSPQVAARIEAARSQGQLVVRAGRAGRPEAGSDGRITLPVRIRGEGAPTVLTAARLYDCTGFAAQPAGHWPPLLNSLQADGLIVTDALGLGLAVSAEHAVIGRNGNVSKRLFVLGPLARGRFWECTAIPDLRRYAVALARTLTA